MAHKPLLKQILAWFAALWYYKNDIKKICDSAERTKAFAFKSSLQNWQMSNWGLYVRTLSICMKLDQETVISSLILFIVN